jgi:hypothetical protein
MALAPNPHPALRATFSRREKETRDCAMGESDTHSQREKADGSST